MPPGKPVQGTFGANQATRVRQGERRGMMMLRVVMLLAGLALLPGCLQSSLDLSTQASPVTALLPGRYVEVLSDQEYRVTQSGGLYAALSSDRNAQPTRMRFYGVSGSSAMIVQSVPSGGGLHNYGFALFSGDTIVLFEQAFGNSASTVPAQFAAAVQVGQAPTGITMRNPAMTRQVLEALARQGNVNRRVIGVYRRLGD